MNGLGGRAAVRIIALAALLFAAGTHSAWADFAEGLAAFDAGDYKGALEAWQPLAEAGEAEAPIALAGLYRGGLGVPADLAAAARWYRRAAEQGAAIAQLNLGDLYSRGAGMPRDLVRAHLWLSLAAAQGRLWADRRRQEIEPSMTAAQRAEAKHLAAAWRPAE